MKKIYSILLISFLVVNIHAQTTFCEDFDSYNNNDPIAQTSPNWNSWDELMNGAISPFTDDAAVTNLSSSSGTNSLYFPNNSLAGPEDVLLMFDPMQNITQAMLPLLSTPYVAGDFEFSQMMYVRSGGGAYFNFQAENMPGQVWALEVALEATGDILMSNTSGTSFACGYPFDQWFEIKFDIDLSNNQWEVFIDGVSQGSFSNTINQVASVDLYTRAGDEFYVDDMCYSYSPATLAQLNGQTTLINPITGLTGQQRSPSVEVRNFGLDPIYSFDISFDYNGTTITENLNNINGGFGLLSMTSMQVDFSNFITLAGGTTVGTAYIYNVNNGMVQSTSDDTLTINIDAVTPAPNKLVLGEEATGTWCGWCPRGAVALNWMDYDYAGYWQGIAVHNGDPMADQIYDLGLGTITSGYPSGSVDRGPDIDPSVFKGDFLQRIVIDPHVVIQTGAEQIGDTLKVSLTINATDYFQGAHKLACVLVEDSVTGQGPQWYQSNSYNGGGAGSLIDVDGTDWANMPGNVPDYLMVYRHVARAISPSFIGETLPLNVYNAGDTETICYEFVLDPSWDLSKIHIVGIFNDWMNRTDNASSVTVAEALAEGYASCQTISSTIYLEGPENDKIQLYPNPADKNISIMNLPSNTEKITVLDINGKTVKEMLKTENINVSDLESGFYQIQIITDRKTINRKFIKE